MVPTAMLICATWTEQNKVLNTQLQHSKNCTIKYIVLELERKTFKVHEKEI